MSLVYSVESFGLVELGMHCWNDVGGWSYIMACFVGTCIACFALALYQVIQKEYKQADPSTVFRVCPWAQGFVHRVSVDAVDNGGFNNKTTLLVIARLLPVCLSSKPCNQQLHHSALTRHHHGVAVDKLTQATYHTNGIWCAK